MPDNLDRLVGMCAVRHTKITTTAIAITRVSERSERKSPIGRNFLSQRERGPRSYLGACLPRLFLLTASLRAPVCAFAGPFFLLSLSR